MNKNNPESFWHFISRFSFHIASGVSILLWASIIVAMLSVMKP